MACYIESFSEATLDKQSCWSRTSRSQDIGGCWLFRVLTSMPSTLTSLMNSWTSNSTGSTTSRRPRASAFCRAECSSSIDKDRITVSHKKKEWTAPSTRDAAEREATFDVPLGEQVYEHDRCRERERERRKARPRDRIFADQRV